ncbi:MAG: dihydroneopterin aldolase family protein [Candidatus Thermoplasmatota archaeon]
MRKGAGLDSKYFNCTDRERAVFEAGIKLGTIYHQFVGTPVSQANVEALEEAIAQSAMVQPFVEDVRVKIDRGMLHERRGEYDYYTLSGMMMSVWLKVRYRSAVAEAEMRRIEELSYPLMFVTGVYDERPASIK